jgi:exodeoxyribonuclease VII small subunit
MKEKDQFNFKEAFEELEKINDWFRKEDFDPDEALKNFRRGVDIVKDAKKRLQKIENEFEEIQKDLADEVKEE